ncbi:NUDIX domain-containing protein [Nocardia sp. NBC_01499]|uniref:NUDIX hydrolase n=1 Tax=Nocardia sp. NBC_01499 TaxID=2903597 RepID=UPI00386ABCEA
MSFRLAAYAVCLEDGRVLLARHVVGNGETTWTLPGGGVEHAEDPFDAVTRELREETGYDGVVERLLGVDSRVIPAAAARAGAEHQNVGIFYRVRVASGRLRAELNGATVEPTWTMIPQVAYLRRSSLVDTGLALAQVSPARVMGPPVCHEHGTGLDPVAGRVLMVTDDRVAGQSVAGLPWRGFWRCR